MLAERAFGPDLVRTLVTGATPEHTLRIPPADLPDLIGRLRYHRLEPQFIRAIEDGLVDVDPEQRPQVAQTSTMLALLGLDLEYLLVTVASVLNEAGIEFLVLKGMATRQLDHPRGTLRQAADVDLLVDDRAYDPAGAALADAGFRPPDEATTLMDKGGAWRLPNGRSVDLHTRPHTAGRNLGRHWWSTAETFDVAGHQFQALSRGGRMAHAASHFSLSFPNHRIFSSLHDLHQISSLATVDEREEAERFLVEIGVSDIVRRITERTTPIVGHEGVVIGHPSSWPLDRILRKAYDRSDLDKAALKLAKAYGMPCQAGAGCSTTGCSRPTAI
ncbi:MAG: nucleotidyltransferase family protein [Actinomycetota bacterium]